MTATPHVPTLAEQLSISLATFRNQKQLSARRLASDCAEAGWPSLDRQRIANLESRRGRDMSVSELLGLAYVLRWYPGEFLWGRLPIEQGDWLMKGWDESEVEISPAIRVKRGTLVHWMSGEEAPWDEPRKGFPSEGVEERPELVPSLDELGSWLSDVAKHYGMRVIFEPLEQPHG